jgi:dienelactone hydrolase
MRTIRAAGRIAGRSRVSSLWMGLGRTILVLAMAYCGGSAQANEEQVVLQTRAGVSETVFYSAAAKPTRSVILFTGGAGVVAGGRNNFLLRVADRFVGQGISVAIPEVPSDHPSGMTDGFRASAENADDIGRVIELLRQRADVPVWLIGTSRGTISAASIAARIGPPRVAGLVLTSTVWKGLRAVTSPDDIRVPTLVVHNRDDGCSESPFAATEDGMAALRRAPIKGLLTVSGGISRSVPCQALSPHGYYGIEDQVTTPMIAWIKTH